MAPAKKKQRLSDGASAAIEQTEDVALGEPKAPENSTASEDTKTDQQHKRSLFVRSLAATTTSESLTALFSDSYPIKHATAVTDPATKQCRGYGFVTFADADDAQRARDEFNGRLVDGRKLRVEVAEPRHRDGGDATAAANERGPGGGGPPAQEPQPTKLIVRNLPWSIKHPDQLSKLFMSYGKVKQAYIPKKGPGLMAGFGFVVMRGRKNSEKAIEGVNGKEIDGRTLAGDWAVEKGVYQDAVKPDAGGDEDENVDLGDRDGEDEDEMELSGLDDKMETDNDDSDMGDDSDDEGVKLGDDEDDEDGDAISEDAQTRANQAEDKSCTLFIRNLPFSCMDENLEDHFTQFGSVRYARVVMDFGTERSKGTGFVCFYKNDDAEACLRGAPRQPDFLAAHKANKDAKAAQTSHSILQNEASDPSGKYTLDGRVLQVSKAVDKSEANRLTEEGTVRRNRRDNDKRRLYLLSEGTISFKSKLWESLAPSEKAMRDASAKQRKTLIESNPSLHLSLTRLSVRNIPRSVDSKELKALARDAVVGFATDVKEGRRQRLSKEELARSSEEMQAAELARKRASRGIVRQAKVVFESASGSKVGEDSGAGRSRGYGFIEYYTHRNALMGLRWLNGHSVGYKVKEDEGKANRDDTKDRKKRLIVEFAIENAQVVMRRNEREEKSRSQGPPTRQGFPSHDRSRASSNPRGDKHFGPRKRKRDFETARPSKPNVNGSGPGDTTATSKKQVDEKLARRNHIIGRKRALRRDRKGAKS